MWKSLVNDLYASLSEQCRDQFERAVLGIHLFNIAENWMCTGLREDQATESSILPENWNQNNHLYSFRYEKNDKTYIIKFIRTGPSVCSVHGLRTDFNDKIFSTRIALDSFFEVLEAGVFADAIENTIIPTYKEEVFSKIEELKKQSSLLISEHRPTGRFSNPISSGIPANPMNPRFPSNPMNPRLPGYPDNPLAQPYPGNMVGPDHPMFGGIPNPNIRYDPTHPTGFPEFPDHFQPPGPGFNNPGGRGGGGFGFF